MIEILKAILFGVVEGVTEWLPVSSTGHMILLDQFVKLDVSPEFWKMFEVVIQLGAIMAVVILYWNTLWPLEYKMYGRKGEKKALVFKNGSLDMWLKIIVSCIPAAIVGVLFDDKIDELFYHPMPVALALIIVGVIFIIIELTRGKLTPTITSISQFTYKTAVIIGLFQLIAAIFPGTSRSGATIIGALLIGVSREIAAEYTFFLAVPVMFGASLLKIVKYIHEGVSMTGMEAAILVIGCITAFAVSIAVIRFLMSYIKKHDFKVFGYYRIVLGILVLLILR
ncbi:MAG: undecaprenyl-diphosphate phosphatase [Lachnospiraceae bacterium]|nr:undecaprenyl-diphosphate phosphatase [Lachnospiraceae bacterium]